MEAALDSVKQWAAGFQVFDEDGEIVREESRQSDEDAIVAQNQRALAELRWMMPGLGV